MKQNHGGNKRETSELYGIPEDSLLDFSSSINPLGPPAGFFASLNENLFKIKSYPDPDYQNFKNAIAQFHGVTPANILPGNGSTELIHLIPRAFRKGKNRALVVVPAFSEYEQALNISGYEIDYFELSESDDFAFPVQEFISRMQNGYDIIFIGNPGNPCGNMIDEDIISMILERAKLTGALLVLDEAFVDFCRIQPDSISLIKDNNIILIRSLTKFFSLPGLRAGYLLANESNIERLSKHLPPWSLNSIAETASIHALNDTAFIEKSHSYIETEREYLAMKLKTIPQLYAYSSAANYLLLKINKPASTSPAASFNVLHLQDWLIQKHKILVRNCENFRGLGNGFFRIAVKFHEENKKLIGALKEYFTNNS